MDEVLNQLNRHWGLVPHAWNVLDRAVLRDGSLQPQQAGTAVEMVPKFSPNAACEAARNELDLAFANGLLAASAFGPT